MRRVLRNVILLLIFVAVGSLAALGWLISWSEQTGPLATAETVVIKHGEGTMGLGRQLADAKIVSNPLAFSVLARLTRGVGELKAGEYAFPAQTTPNAVLALLRSGKTVIHHLVIPEGTTSAGAVALIESAEALRGHVDIPPAEGTLEPETYFYSWGDSRTDLVKRMETGMKRELAALWADRAPNLSLDSPQQAVTLASIVEKETAIESERAKIAGVFYNRIKQGMKLQSDPTVVYALTGGRDTLGRPLNHADLATDSPYNTYLVKGLPLGPIGNPGRAALLAVLHPETTDALFFVADGSGGHAFAAKLETHNQNVARWRKLEAGTTKPPA